MMSNHVKKIQFEILLLLNFRLLGHIYNCIYMYMYMYIVTVVLVY